MNVEECPECKSRDLARDYERAETACNKCGLVIDEGASFAVDEKVPTREGIPVDIDSYGGYESLGGDIKQLRVLLGQSKEKQTKEPQVIPYFKKTLKEGPEWRLKRLIDAASGRTDFTEKIEDELDEIKELFILPEFESLDLKLIRQRILKGAEMLRKDGLVGIKGIPAMDLAWWLTWRCTIDKYPENYEKFLSKIGSKRARQIRETHSKILKKTNIIEKSIFDIDPMEYNYESIICNLLIWNKGYARSVSPRQHTLAFGEMWARAEHRALDFYQRSGKQRVAKHLVAACLFFELCLDFEIRNWKFLPRTPKTWSKELGIAPRTFYDILSELKRAYPHHERVIVNVSRVLKGYSRLKASL